jgi:hypothetical protein
MDIKLIYVFKFMRIKKIAIEIRFCFTIIPVLKRLQQCPIFCKYTGRILLFLQFLLVAGRADGATATSIIQVEMATLGV